MVRQLCGGLLCLSFVGGIPQAVCGIEPTGIERSRIEPVPVGIYADGEGQEDLDKATELKLSARTLRDLDKVSDLCESAIDKGLDEDGESFARELWASTLYEYASRLGQQVFGQQPPDPRWQFMRRQALPRLQQALELKPEWPEALLLVARFNGMPGGDREAAVSAVEQALEFADDSDKMFLSEAYLWRGNLSEDSDEQLEFFNKALEANPRNSDALRVRGFYHYLKQNSDEAAADFGRLVELSPEDISVRQAFAEALIAAEKFDEALAAMDEVVELQPTIANSYLMRARVQLILEEGDEALEDLDKALEIEPDSVEALILRSRVNLELDRLDDARDDVDTVLSIRPGLVQGILTRSLIAAAQERYAEAAEDMELLVENSPENLPWRLQLAMLYYVDDRPSKALESYANILRLDEENPQALRGRGDVYLNLGKHDKALEDYDAALAVDPENSALLNNMSWLLSTSPDDELRDGKRAIELALKASELTEYQQAHILSTLASGYAETGDFEKAKEWAAKAVDMARDEEQREGLQEELDSYEEGKPWRERQELTDRETDDSGEPELDF